MKRKFEETKKKAQAFKHFEIYVLCKNSDGFFAIPCLCYSVLEDTAVVMFDKQAMVEWMKLNLVADDFKRCAKIALPIDQVVKRMTDTGSVVPIRSCALRKNSKQFTFLDTVEVLQKPSVFDIPAVDLYRKTAEWVSANFKSSALTEKIMQGGDAFISHAAKTAHDNLLWSIRCHAGKDYVKGLSHLLQFWQTTEVKGTTLQIIPKRLKKNSLQCNKDKA